MRGILGFLMFVSVLAPVSFARAQELGEEELWLALRSGEAFGMIRHALAPGTGDPEAFTLGDCSTQRNLSQEGRDQAAAIGDAFRANGIESAAVYSSAWCRCLDTAELLGLGPVTVFSPLNSFFQRPGRAEQTRATREWLLKRKGKQPLVLVTHQVNISALTGVYAGSGQVVVARIDAGGVVEVLGSL